MSTSAFPFQSDPVPIPSNEDKSYKDLIKQLAAQAPEPYGAIPPLMKRKDKSKKKKSKKSNRPKALVRRMSHVENWLAVDSKESIPDEEELVHSSPFRNFLSTDFLVLPLHMPPPSLSATPNPIEDNILSTQSKSSNDSKGNNLRPGLYPVDESSIQVIPITGNRDLPLVDDEDEDEDEEEEDDEDEELDEDDLEDQHKTLNKRHSFPSFLKSSQPSTSTTKSYALSTSPPSNASSPILSVEDNHKNRWMETIAQLRRSLKLSLSSSSSKPLPDKPTLIPMPPPPKRTGVKKRRSEATTQPRFNPETNTYIRDTRSNPDHLRMISAELNMMRNKKLSSPLKPRGFLPRRQDVFIRGDQRTLSNLKNEL